MEPVYSHMLNASLTKKTPEEPPNSWSKWDNCGMKGLKNSAEWNHCHPKHLNDHTRPLWQPYCFQDAPKLLKRYHKLTIWPIKIKPKPILGDKSLFQCRKYSPFMLCYRKANTELAYPPQFLQASLLDHFKLQVPFLPEPLEGGWSLSPNETTLLQKAKRNLGTRLFYHFLANRRTGEDVMTSYKNLGSRLTGSAPVTETINPSLQLSAGR